MHGLIKETENWILRNITGTTNFKGCQCYKDCSCQNDFIPSSYSYFTVKRKNGRMKTTDHTFIEEAEERCKFIDDGIKNGTISNTVYVRKWVKH
tara:strand:+ start:1902 stop:2183 length:282 start_codon:yes stop_codon:yes gene_type:complete